MLPDVQSLRQELYELLHSWEYAFAMGHGCSIGRHPDHGAIRQRAADLRARIRADELGGDCGMAPKTLARVHRRDPIGPTAPGDT